ncbi:hypothetical protein BDN72DRAFT_737614, partial [Pluteus cervinus]
TTSPVASTSWTAGTPQTISWQDDGSAPSLKDFGVAKISIYAGNAQQQTLLQAITTNTDVSTTGSLQFTPDPTIGPDSSEYFIRFESVNTKDPKNPQYPALAFSAKFTLSGMSGQFSAAVQAQIDGQSTAPLAGASTSAAASAATSAGAGATTAKPSSASTTPSKSASAAGASHTNSAVSVKAGWIGALVGLVAG